MMGPQGSGKGTIGEMLSKRLGIPLLSVGQILRDLPETHKKYQELQRIMVEGHLAPQKFVAELLMEEVAQPEYEKGYILDGWGRTMYDLECFDPGFDLVLFLKIAPETSLKRLGNRLTCKKCGRVYNLVSVPPKVAGVCDVCGGELHQREDDTEDAIKKRLSIYYSDTKRVLNHFKGKGILIAVDAEAGPEEVYKSALASVKSHADKH